MVIIVHFDFLHIGSDSLQSLQTENAQYVCKLSHLVLQETDREKTRLYANLILTQGYIRVVIEEMIEEGELIFTIFVCKLVLKSLIVYIINLSFRENFCVA